jgi:hypothetical protein
MCRGGALLGGILLSRNYTTSSYLFRVNRTPAQQYTLRSPISLPRVPLKCPTLYESEAAEALLSLFSPRLGTLDLPDYDYTMDVNSEIQVLTPSDLGVAAASRIKSSRCSTRSAKIYLPI